MRVALLNAVASVGILQEMLAREKTVITQKMMRGHSVGNVSPERSKMPKGIKKDLYKAIENVNESITNSAGRGGAYARGLASEGYNGGYRQALYDVIAALNDVPNCRSRFWPTKAETPDAP